MTRNFIVTVVCLVASSSIVPPAGFAAGGVGTDMATRNEDLMQNGNYAKAAELGEKFLKECPTGCDMGPDGVFKVRYNLAWCYYLLPDYPKAIDAFQKLSSEKVSNEDLRQQAMQLVGDAFSRYAGSLQDPKDKKDNYNKAIDQYTKYLGQYPKSESMADVLYGRGLAYFRVERYDDSERDLRDLLERFRTSDLVLDAKYMLATVLGTHGSSLRKNNKAEEATKYLQASRDLFKEIIASSDIALANDAAYAAGEIFIQLKEYDTAIAYYRGVRNRDEVLASQQDKVDKITRMLAQATGAGSDRRRIDQIRNWLTKEKSKLTDISNASDLLLAANMRIADCLFQEKKYAEARVMYRFVYPHARLPDREIAKQSLGQIVATYIGESRPFEARQAFEDFEKEYGVDPLAEPFGLAIGDQFLRRGKPEDALKQVDKSLSDFPKSSYVPMLKFRRAMALDALGQHAEAAKQMDEVANDPEIKKTASDEVEYALGKMLRGLGRFDEAIKHLNAVVDKNPNFELIDDVQFQVALCYKGKKEYDKAVESFRKFMTVFEGKSQLVVPALYQVGQCYEAKDDIDNAIKTYRELVTKYPSDKLAPFAQYQIAIVYYNKDKLDKMVEAFEELIKKFAGDALVCDSRFWIGFKFQKERNYPKAIEQFETVVKDCPTNALASDAQYRIGNSWQNAAFAMGNYKAQDEKSKPVWRDDVAKAVAAFERLIADYPKSAQLNDGLDGLTQLQLARIAAEVEKLSDVDAYFNKLSSQHAADNPVLAARILICLATIDSNLHKPDEAINMFNKAFEGLGDETLPAKYYDDFAGLLVEAKKFDQAIDLYLKMEDKFKDDPQTQANAVWGLGNAYLQAGAYEKAVAEFDRLMKEFPWHKHAADAQFGKGLVLEAQKKYDEALKIYEDVAVKLKGEARIRSLLGLGRCQMAKGDCKNALENFQKVSLFYEKFPEFASEALWLGGQCAEKLAATAANPADRQKNIQDAIQQYRDLLLKYPNTKYVDDAKKRLNELAPSK